MNRRPQHQMNWAATERHVDCICGWLGAYANSYRRARILFQQHLRKPTPDPLDDIRPGA